MTETSALVCFISSCPPFPIPANLLLLFQTADSTRPHLPAFHTVFHKCSYLLPPSQKETSTSVAFPVSCCLLFDAQMEHKS